VNFNWLLYCQVSVVSADVKVLSVQGYRRVWLAFWCTIRLPYLLLFFIVLSFQSLHQLSWHSGRILTDWIRCRLWSWNERCLMSHCFKSKFSRLFLFWKKLFCILIQSISGFVLCKSSYTAFSKLPRCLRKFWFPYLPVSLLLDTFSINRILNVFRIFHKLLLNFVHGITWYIFWLSVYSSILIEFSLLFN